MSGALVTGDALQPVILGLILWVIALIVLILCHDSLVAAGTTWWYGACFVGIISGILGVGYIRYRRRREGGIAR